MTMSIIRKGAILAACLTALGTWTVAVGGSIAIHQGGAQRRTTGAASADYRRTGTADLTYDPATRVLTWNLNYSGLSGPATMVHFHGPAPRARTARR